jgi:hypothetical protein
MATQDPRLERLYDYTKFHIGIYILAASTMITLAATRGTSRFLDALIRHQTLLLLAIAALAMAGMAGGIIISSTAVASAFDKVWDEKIGPWGTRVVRGKSWAIIEHLMFWASALLFAAAALWP